MKVSRFTLCLLAAGFITTNAWALQIDDKTNTAADGSVKLADPDDKVPYPHFDDNGQLQSGQQINLSSGGNQPLLSGGQDAQPSNAFNRAVDNQK